MTLDAAMDTRQFQCLQNLRARHVDPAGQRGYAIAKAMSKQKPKKQFALPKKEKVEEEAEEESKRENKSRSPTPPPPPLPEKMHGGHRWRTGNAGPGNKRKVKNKHGGHR